MGDDGVGDIIGRGMVSGDEGRGCCHYREGM